MLFSNFVLQRMSLFIVFILARFYFSWLRFEFEYLTLNFSPTSIEIIKICFSFKAVIIIVSYSQVSTIIEQLLQQIFETENCKTVFKTRLISSRTCVELYFNSTFLLSNNVFVCLFDISPQFFCCFDLLNCCPWVEPVSVVTVTYSIVG